MNKQGHKSFFIGDWQVSPQEGLLSHENNLVHLEPKAMEVLVYFASRPGDVITREELERDVWSGALVGYDAVTNTIIKLRKALQDNARQPRFIATIPKKGYQLIASIRYVEDDSNPCSVQDLNQSVSESPVELSTELLTELLSVKAFASPHWSKKKLHWFIFFAVLIIGMLWLWPLSINKNKFSPPSIAVLPFENLSDDPKQEYLADGMTEDIITDLSRLSNILVISSNTSSKYKGKKISAKEVGQDLNINYVLRGTIRRLGEEVRVNTQLVNTSTGFNAWAQRYDRKVTEVFVVQDEVTDSIVKALTVKMTNQEKQRLAKRATNSLKAYDYFQDGQKISLIRTTEAFEQARESYKKAIELDPGYGRAYGAMAVTLAFDFVEGWHDSPNIVLDRALTLAKKAVALDDSTPQTHWALSFVYLMQKEFEHAENAVTQAIRIAPNYADGYGLLALIKMHIGEPERAIEINNKAMRLNPYYTWQYLYTQGAAYYMLGNFNSAITILEDALARNQNAILVKLYLAASYLRAGRQDDAEWMIYEIQILRPKANLSIIEKSIRLAKAETKLKLLNDLRNAGLPE